MAGSIEGLRVETFADDGAFPNSTLPLLLYEQALLAGAAGAQEFEALFEANGWPAAWRASVFPYHHYHSTAHEALGVLGAAGVLLTAFLKGREILLHYLELKHAGRGWRVILLAYLLLVAALVLAAYAAEHLGWIQSLRH